MAKTSNIFARVEPTTKEQAEKILEQLGIPMSNAIDMYLRQIIIQRGIPFEMKLPVSIPLSAGSLSADELDRELAKGYEDVLAGHVFSAEDVTARIHRNHGI